jgi:DNA-binding beta-propeller fold protein YncE
VLRASEARHDALILAVLACLAGCTTATPSVPAQGSNSALVFAALRPDAQHYEDDVLSTQPGNNNATVYKQNGDKLTLLQTLSTGIATPQGAVATPSDWWYLTNAGDANVLIYRITKKGPKGPVGELEDYGEVPDNVAVTPDRKLVAVSNLAGASDSTGSVSVYLNRRSSPSRILTYGSDWLQGEGVAIDPQGDCFWSFNDLSKPSTPGSIVEFSGCQGAGLPVVSGLTSAGGLAFDTSGNLYYIDEAKGVYKCAPSCGIFAKGFGLPVNMNFDAGDQHLWVADATGYLDAVNPTYGNIEHQTISIDGDPYGIAPAPGN